MIPDPIQQRDAWTIDPRRAKQFCTRKESIAAAKALGYPQTVTYRYIMGFRLWFICNDHLLLTEAGQTARESDRCVRPLVGWERDWT